MAEPTVYVFTDWEKENLRSVITQLIEDIPSSDKELVIIDGKHCLANIVPIATTLPGYLMDIYRRFGDAKNEWMTVLNADDELCALQLCVADMNMQATGDFDIPVSDVLTALQGVQQMKLGTFAKSDSLTQDISSENTSTKDVYNNYEQFLKSCNYIDFYDIFKFYQKCSNSKDSRFDCLNQKSFILLDLPTDPVEKSMLQFLCSTRKVIHITSEISLIDDLKELKFHHTEIASLDVLYEDKLPCPCKTPKSGKLSSTHKYIYQIFCAYLDLLVNSRSQISLARVLNVPDRGLDHQAFTDLKREAKKSGLPMYQHAVSFVMKLRLGGKGYAPGPNNHLMPHVKGLSMFMDLLHKLQTIIEEDQDIRSASQRVVNIIKNTILKSKDSLSKKPAVESASKQIQTDINNAVNNIEQKTFDSPSKPASQGGSLCGRKSLQVLQKVLDQVAIHSLGMQSLNVLSDILCTQGTPVRIPSLVSQFRSPDVELDPEEDKPLTKRICQIKPKQNALMTSNRSHYDWASKSPGNGTLIVDAEYILPSKTLMYPSSAKKVAPSKLTEPDNNDKENDPSIVSKEVEFPQEDTSPLGSQPTKKLGATKRKQKSHDSKAKQCRRKLLPQIKGQAALTAFFKG
ncbi:PCNA-interacting partner-like isoform X1 [Argonauta hians]